MMKRIAQPLFAVALLALAACDSDVRGPDKIEFPAPPVNGELVGDLKRGERVAQACVECHGMDGVRAASGAPFIAGVKQDYLVRSLLAYRDGTRNHKAMLEVSNVLDPLQLADVTAYYASLETPWQGAVADADSRAVLQDSQARSEAAHIVTGCKSCHSQAGRKRSELTVPVLDGMPLEYFVPALKSYADGGRSNEIMAMFKGKLNDEDIYKLGAYYAARQPRQPEVSEIGNPAKGKIAARACAGCHGFEGNSLNPHIPNLAGQPADYLVKVTKDYRDGKRKEPLMQAATARLNDRTIVDLAAYFSRQQPRSQLHQDLESEKTFDPLADGERIAASCNTCHGKAGNSRTKGVPSLTGLSVKYIVKATRDYEQGRRKHAAMQEIVSFYSDTDIEKAAYYYATRTPKPHFKPSIGGLMAGEALAEACVSCHGENGVSSDPDQTPSLAGQEAGYLMTATKAYAEGERGHQAMADVAAKLDAQQIKDLATYFAAQAPQAVETYLPNNPDYLVAERCSRCHGEQGFSTTPGVPRLAGQLESYIVYALKEYQDGIRKDPHMVPMASVLSLLEIKAMAAYYARQQAPQPAR